MLTQVDNEFGAVAFNVTASFVAVAYGDNKKVWEAISRDALASRASLATDMPTRGDVFVVAKGKT